MKIVAFHEDHWHAVKEIYRLGILSGNATFETEVPDLKSWQEKFHRHLLWVIADDAQIAGWAGLLPVSSRQVYAGVAEVSIYIHPGYQGKGVGRILMNHLILESERSGIWTLQASIFPENVPSIALHRSSGFREIGYREKIARLNGKWQNTVLFERRSAM